MSHDETSDTVTRKERRKAYGGKRKNVTPRPYVPADHVRPDWETETLIEMLEDRARGYNGMLRQLLCTSASMLRTKEIALEEYRSQAISEMLDAVEGA